MKLYQKYVTILKVRVDSTTRSGLLKDIGEKLKAGRQFLIVTPNPEIVLMAQADHELLSFLNHADFAVPDGVGFKIVHPLLPIIKGRELMIDLLAMANSLKLRVYLLGARPQVNKAAVEKIKKEFHGVYVKGNGEVKVDNRGASLQSDMVIKDINSFKPDLLFVAFGAPKQELWLDQNYLKLKARGIMVVGGALDYYAGFARKVPGIFGMFGLEWLWRLIQEPERIRRVFNATVIFPIKAILGGF